jgi:hypothetical protein
MFAEDFACFEVDDGGAGFVDEHEDSFAAVGFADAKVVHSGGVTQADVTVGVDAVVA